MIINLKSLEKIVANCKKCPLAKTRTNIVFGDGNINSKILFVGEGPGQKEDLTGLPFVGRSGELLDELLKEINLSRKKIYIANIIKCRPPNNRDPLPGEINACINYLRWQFKIINPEIIICVGRIAAQKIIKKDFRITKEHGKWFQKKNIEIMATFHPAALLRNPNNLVYAREDFKKIKSKLNQLIL